MDQHISEISPDLIPPIRIVDENRTKRHRTVEAEVAYGPRVVGQYGDLQQGNAEHKDWRGPARVLVLVEVLVGHDEVDRVFEQLPERPSLPLAFEHAAADDLEEFGEVDDAVVVGVGIPER